jgi:ferredoxin-NADP reductase
VRKLCGPDVFMDDVGATMVSTGVAPERIHTERFGDKGGRGSASARGGVMAACALAPATTIGDSLDARSQIRFDH